MKSINLRGPEVRSLLDTGKCEVVRAVKPQPSEHWSPHNYTEIHKMRDGQFVMRKDEPVVIGWGPCNADGDEGYPCLFGAPGDELWVRETWQALHYSIDPETGYADDWAPAKTIPQDFSNGWWDVCYKSNWDGDVHPQDRGFRWRSPLTMPRWASRMTVRVLSVECRKDGDLWNWVADIERIERKDQP